MVADVLLLALYCYFVAGILGSFFARFAQKYFGPSALFSHGKAAISAVSKPKMTNSWYELIKNSTVSKNLFWHFYAFGWLSSLIFCIESSDISVAPILLAFQCFRRLIECFFVMPGADGSRMHLIHYGIGITYYPILLLSFHYIKRQQDKSSVYWIGLFVLSSAFQCYCHWILGSLRKKIKSDQSHRPINHRLFKIIHAPHYFAEFLIYFSIGGLEGFHPLMLLNLIWIVAILGVSAKNSADWLCEKWGHKKHEEFCKYLMVPFLF